VAESRSYKIIIGRKAEKEAGNIPLPQRHKIDKAIFSLANSPRAHNCKKLAHKEGYRIRAANYRVLYTIDDDAKTVVVYRIKIKGKDTYK
jgi:mRNA interferase RelE/StbE